MSCIIAFKLDMILHPRTNYPFSSNTHHIAVYASFRNCLNKAVGTLWKCWKGPMELIDLGQDSRRII